MSTTLSASTAPHTAPSSGPGASQAATRRGKPRPPPGKLSLWVLSSDPERREALKLCLLAAMVYLAWIILMPTVVLPKGLLSN